MKSISLATKTKSRAQMIRGLIRDQMRSIYIPASVYRLQLNPDFRFEQATSILDYLRDLGVDAVYLSPFFQAVPGSRHGYDVTNPRKINPDVGANKDYRVFCERLQILGLKQIIDVVPNHMGISANNSYWMDVLENGPQSTFARFFDINWNPGKGNLKNKVLLPFLGDFYGCVLERGELQLRFAEGAFFIAYHEHKFPIAPHTYPTIFDFEFDKPEGKSKRNASDFRELKRIIRTLKMFSMNCEDGESQAKYHRMKEREKKRLSGLAHKSRPIWEVIQKCVNELNGKKGKRHSYDALDALLDQQFYRLAFWRVASEEINYRRFFDVNQLAAIRMEDDKVFNYYHGLLFELIAEGHVQGLRIDHPDGLYDPKAYFEKLQRGCLISKLMKVNNKMSLSQVSQVLKNEDFKQRAPMYVVAEKILDRREFLPADWRVHGTTGYDVSRIVDGLFIDGRKGKQFRQVYEEFIGGAIDLENLIYEKKKFFALVHMASEINNLAHLLDQISNSDRRYRDFTLNNLTVAIREVIACFPVYRTYVSPTHLSISEHDENYVHIAVEKAKRKTPAISRRVYEYLKSILLLKSKSDGEGRFKKIQLDFVLRFQQLSGPIMAKGFEDTVFYIYNRLISLNEVGGDPARFGNSAAEFHQINVDRNKKWPANFITSSTHDSKRSEDVRMRISALSEVADEWRENVLRWARINERHKTLIDGLHQPSRNTEYFIYQSMIGVWPLEVLTQKDYDTFTRRMCDSMLKSVREAKVDTNWVNPNEEYERSVQEFVLRILSRQGKNLFLKSFIPFQKNISRLGMLNSLSALVLKIGLPGVVDTYQGAELWNFALVDPDNRRPVNYEKRIKMLGAIKEALLTKSSTQVVKELLDSPKDGGIKLFVLSKALNLRRTCPNLFIGAHYLSLTVRGKKEKNVVAYLRRHGRSNALFICGRFFHEVDPTSRGLNLTSGSWRETRLMLPKEIREGENFRDILTNRKLCVRSEQGESFLLIHEIFRHLSCAILTSEANKSLS